MTRLSGTLITVDGRDALRFVRTLRHDVERVWRAVSAPEELSQWFVASVDWTPEAGETFDVMGTPLVVTVADPPHTLAWEWGEERYAFTLAPDADGGTQLTFTHVFVTTHGPGDQHAAGWETYLDRLDGLLAGAPVDELAAHDPIAEYHEAYAHAFGADPAAGRRMIASMGFRDLAYDADAHTVRLVRRYRHPIARMWRAFTDPDDLRRWFPEPDRLRVTRADEPTLLEATWWDAERLRVELRADGDGTVVTFEHRLSDENDPARNTAGWDRSFFALDALLAGVPVDRETTLEHWGLVYERYAARLADA